MKTEVKPLTGTKRMRVARITKKMPKRIRRKESQPNQLPNQLLGQMLLPELNPAKIQQQCQLTYSHTIQEELMPVAIDTLESILLIAHLQKEVDLPLVAELL